MSADKEAKEAEEDEESDNSQDWLDDYIIHGEDDGNYNPGYPQQPTAVDVDAYILANYSNTNIQEHFDDFPIYLILV